MNPLSGLRKKSTVLATSSNVPIRGIACRARSRSIVCLGTERIRFVARGPGPTQFTVMPNSANSRAKTARRLNDDGSEEEVSLDLIVVGDRLRVRPGEKI